jgi:hypothetical protein
LFVFVAIWDGCYGLILRLRAAELCSRYLLGVHLFIGLGAEPSPLLLRPLSGVLCQPWMIDVDRGAISGMNDLLNC